MHELAICATIADSVAATADGRPVAAVNLVVGHFRQIVPDTLKFCWEMTTSEGPLASCMLNISEMPVILECHECSFRTTLTDPILRCGSCQSTSVQMSSGDEFLIESIDFASTNEDVLLSHPRTRESH